MTAAQARRARAVVLLAIAVATSVATLADAHWQPRPLLAVAFFLLVPGCALVSHRGLDDPLAEATVGAAVSVAISTGVALLAILLHRWNPSAIQVGLAGLSAPLLVDQIRRPARRCDP